MKKKHYIKDISDIKYCEEHKRLVLAGVYSDTYKFEDGVWNRYDSDGNLDYYNIGISTTDGLYYYEEESAASKNDVGKLCLFWNFDADKPLLGILEDTEACEYRYKCLNRDWYIHCSPLTKEEIQEFMEKAE